MQAIYDNVIGDVRQYIESGIINEVKKEDNWRCAKNVINLINQIRDDGLVQRAAGKNLDGRITFLYSDSSSIDIEKIKQHEVFTDFDFNNYEQNKELYLTHKLIAREFGFADLLANYKYKDNLTGNSPDSLIKHLLKIQEVIFLYQTNRFNEFIKRTDFKVVVNDDLKFLKKTIEQLINSGNNTIEEVLSLADDLGLVIKDDRMKKFIVEQEDQYNEVKDIQYAEIESLYDYRDKHSPYSTQHGVKGAEFKNVFMVLDNGNWNKYNFEYLFNKDIFETLTVTKQNSYPNILDRTTRLFYVGCSRAKENLVVFFHKPSTQVLNQAKAWFGTNNIFELS